MTLDDLREWVIAYAGSAGQGYVGKPALVPDHGPVPHIEANGMILLDAPYVLASGYVVTPQGQLARPMILFPLELLVNSAPLRVHYDALLRLRDLEHADFKAVARSLIAGIQQAEQMRADIRTQRSGLVMPPAARG